MRFEQSSAIIFPTLQSALDTDFNEFKQLISRVAVVQGSLESQLLGRIENQLEQRRLNSYYTAHFTSLKRSNLYHLIEDAVTTAFSEEIISGNPELLEKLYVRTPERTRFDSRIQMHIARRQSPFAKQPKRPMKDKESGALHEILLSAATKAKPVAVLVLGTVGAGKTTFLNFTRQIAAREWFEAKKDTAYPHWIYIDFRDFAPSESPSRFIFAALRAYIQGELFLSDYGRCLRPAYKAEIDALLRGPFSLIAKREDEVNNRISDILFRDYDAIVPYVEKVLGYAGSHAPLFLVIDNIDQLEAENLQPSIFSDGIAIAHRLGLNLILSLRDATYVSQRSLPVFDAFDFDPIYIDTPNVDAVLSRRFTIAKQILSGRPVEFIAENGADVKLEDSSVIIDLVQASVLGTQVSDLIDVLAAGDVRLALRITREFLQYGYTATGHALEVYHKTGKYTLPTHEALRAILLGNQSVYSDKYSVLGNPLDSKLSRTEFQLLRLYVLTALVNLSSAASFQFCRGTDIQEALSTIGFGQDVALSVLTDLCRFRFLHTLSHTAASIEANYIPTRLGGYIVRKLIADVMFLENVLMDTFIADSAVWTEVRALTDKIYGERDEVARVKLRSSRLQLFFSYMNALYDPLSRDSARRGLSKEWCTNPLHAVETEFNSNLKRALYSAERNYPESSVFVSSAQKDLDGYVAMFDDSKGFGFVRFRDGSPDAFLTRVIVKRGGHETLPPGAKLVCDVVEAERGPLVTAIRSVVFPAPRAVEGPELIPGLVKFYDSKKGFGFVVPDAGGADIFVQVNTLKDAGLSSLEAGQRVWVATSLGRAGPRAETIKLES